MTLSAAAVIPAAGSGTRMKLDHPKQFLLLDGIPLLVHTVRRFHHHPLITRTIVAVPADWIPNTREMFRSYRLLSNDIQIVAGGRRRQDSVRAGLDLLGEETDIVLVHDGARPFVSVDLISRCAHAAQERGAAIAAIPVKDTLKRGAGDNTISDTVDREGLWQAQTPQAAKRPLLVRAFDLAGDTDVTDESMLLELAGIPVTLVSSEETNIKITRPEDLELARKIMQPSSPPQFRIGHGFDAHRLVEERKLVLGGVTVPYHLGLAGHSDADVVTHALCDALLGALGRGDIGKHFPDSDDSFKGISSILLLERVMELLGEKNFEIGNLDVTIVCQAPKLAPHIPAMKENFANICAVDIDLVNVKATTTEQMGYEGRGEGISCHAVALLQHHHQ